MNIIQITPGAGGMFCGGCLRDNALVAALRRQNHSALMVPLYLPITLDEPDQSAGTPIFYGGINVYLEQKIPAYRHAPRWLQRALSGRGLLRWAAGRAAKTRAADVSELALSMIRGEEGNQARELEELIVWLQTQAAPDVICLSNVLLVGMARRLKAALHAPVVCLLTGEDSFLDALPDTVRGRAWKLLQERCRDVDLFLAPTQYYSDYMSPRLQLAAERTRLVLNGINLAAYEAAPETTGSPVIGFFARMCPEKGLDTLVDAFLLLRQRPGTKQVRLHVGGSCGPSDESFVAAQQEKLRGAGALGDTQFFPNVDHAEKVAFYRSLTVFSAPARFNEAFGLYVIEAMAAGVPVVQPRHAAFPELIAATGGGILCEPENPASLADALENLLLDPARRRRLGAQGRETVGREFSIEQMATAFLRVVSEVLKRAPEGVAPIQALK